MKSWSSGGMGSTYFIKEVSSCSSAHTCGCECVCVCVLRFHDTRYESHATGSAPTFV